MYWVNNLFNQTPLIPHTLYVIIILPNPSNNRLTFSFCQPKSRITTKQSLNDTNELFRYTCNAGDPGSIPGWGRSPGEGNGNTLQYSCLENPMDRGGWWATTVHGVVKSWIFTFTAYTDTLLDLPLTSNKIKIKIHLKNTQKKKLSAQILISTQSKLIH